MCSDSLTKCGKVLQSALLLLTWHDASTNKQVPGLFSPAAAG